MNNIVGLSKIGLVRKQNEDRFFISDNICAVTDGMGGYRGGEIASTYAVDEIKEYLQSTPTINETSLVDAILHANTRIVNRVAREERLSGMGTTAVVVAKVDDNLLWASVGDSRLYIYRNDELTQITTDHSMVQQLLDAGEITKEEAIELIHTSDDDTMILLAMADKIRQHFNDNSVDVCAIVNARSGKCPENCKFCAQSAHHETGVQVYPFMDDESILDAARKAKEAGAIRFSIVTSGRNTNNPNEFNQIIRVLGRIKDEVGLEICCSLGLLTYEQALKLKEVGVTRYHSNIETAPSHFPDICTTHSYEDKMSTIDNAQKAGIRVCSGGILGLNETLEQRVEMAFELKRLHIDSVPLNILNPVKGTPFESNKALRPLDILRTFAVFRFILPNALIRTAGGREVNLRDLQAYALKGGLNGIMVGGYLTTGGRSPQDDLQMIQDLELSRNSAQV